MKARRKWQAIGATVASSAALLGMGALDTGALAAGAVHKCGNKSFTVKVEHPATTPEGQPTFSSFPVKAKNIMASGLSCSAAFKFIGHQYNNTTGKTPENFTCKSGFGKYKEPPGFIPTVCTRKGAKVIYGAQGG